MNSYLCKSDGHQMQIEADSAAAAAQRYVEYLGILSSVVMVVSDRGVWMHVALLKSPRLKPPTRKDGRWDFPGRFSMAYRAALVCRNF